MDKKLKLCLITFIKDYLFNSTYFLCDIDVETFFPSSDNIL